MLVMVPGTYIEWLDENHLDLPTFELLSFDFHAFEF